MVLTGTPHNVAQNIWPIEFRFSLTWRLDCPHKLAQERCEKIIYFTTWGVVASVPIFPITSSTSGKPMESRILQLVGCARRNISKMLNGRAQSARDSAPLLLQHTMIIPLPSRKRVSPRESSPHHPQLKALASLSAGNGHAEEPRLPQVCPCWACSTSGTSGTSCTRNAVERREKYSLQGAYATATIALPLFRK